MSDMLQDGLEWLNGKMLDHASRSLTIIRGTDQIVDVSVVPRDIFRDQADENGFITKVVFRNYQVIASDYDFGSGKVRPQSGDTFKEVVEDKTYFYQATSIGDEPAWAWSDPRHLAYEVHTKLIRTE